MKILKQILFLSALYFISLNAWGQNDTARKVYSASSVRYVKLDDLHSDTLTFKNLDTNSLGFQNFNPVFSDNLPRIYLGNLGLAQKAFVLEDKSTFGFDNGKKTFDVYLKNLDDIKFYRVFSPYTNLYYIWNRRKEQYFYLTFAQNIGPRLNYAVNFNRLVSYGDYDRQVADHLKYDISIWYTDKSRRYQLNAALINNNLSIQENGGIKNDSIFLKASEINSEFEPVFLNNASNRISDKQYLLRQSFAFGPREEFTVDSLKISRIRPKFRIYHELRVFDRKDEYRETPLDSGVYADIFLDSINTSDVIQYLKIENRLGFEYFKSNKKSSRYHLLNAHIRSENIDYTNINIDSNMNAISLHADLNFQISSRIELIGRLKSGLVGDFSDNKFLEAGIRYYAKNDSNYIQVNTLYRSNDQALMFNRYSSNHYEFNNQFDDEQTVGFGLKYVNLKRNFSTGFAFRAINNELYFDTINNLKVVPNYQYVQFNVQKLFRLGKFYLNNIVYVQSNTQSEIIRLPLVHTYQSIYFQSHLFKKALFLRTGFDVRYYTETNAYQYNAALQNFNLDNVSLGDYPLIDFFVTAGLKRAVLLLKIDHLNQGFWNRGSAYIRNYPMPDRALKIGLRWAFYD